MQGYLVMLIVMVCVSAPPGLSAAELSTGDALIRAMHGRYQHDWYSTLKFEQKSTTYNPDGTTKVETWYEAALLPGKLRIDVGPPADGNTRIITDGRVYVFQNGKLTNSRPYVNLLLLLGFDVYGQPPEATLGQLKQEGIDTSKLHEDTWQGEPVYVVGAAEGDVTSKQFWIEKKRLLFLRLIEPDPREPSKLADIRFLKYRRLAHGWLAERVEVHQEGRLTFSEDYSAVETGIPLDPSLFDPKAFEAQHAGK